MAVIRRRAAGADVASARRIAALARVQGTVVLRTAARRAAFGYGGAERRERSHERGRRLAGGLSSERRRLRGGREARVASAQPRWLRGGPPGYIHQARKSWGRT